MQGLQRLGEHRGVARVALRLDAELGGERLQLVHLHHQVAGEVAGRLSRLLGRGRVRTLRVTLLALLALRCGGVVRAFALVPGLDARRLLAVPAALAEVRGLLERALVAALGLLRLLLALSVTLAGLAALGLAALGLLADARDLVQELLALLDPLVDLLAVADAGLEVAVHLFRALVERVEVVTELVVLAEELGALLGQLRGLLEARLNLLRAVEPLADEVVQLRGSLVHLAGERDGLLLQILALGERLLEGRLLDLALLARGLRMRGGLVRRRAMLAVGMTLALGGIAGRLARGVRLAVLVVVLGLALLGSLVRVVAFGIPGVPRRLAAAAGLATRGRRLVRVRTGLVVRRGALGLAALAHGLGERV